MEKTNKGVDNPNGAVAIGAMEELLIDMWTGGILPMRGPIGREKEGRLQWMEKKSSTQLTPVACFKAWLCMSACPGLVNGDDLVDVGLLDSRAIGGARRRGTAGVQGHSSSLLLFILSGHDHKVINLFLLGVSKVYCGDIFGTRCID